MKKEEINALAKSLFVEGKPNQEGYKPVNLNRDIKIELNNEQENAQLMVAAIDEWGAKGYFFCSGSDPKQVSMGYKVPSTCGSCVRAQEFVSLIWGSTEVFNSLPFVEFHGDRQYSFKVDLLRYFAEYGREKTEERIKQIRLEEQRKKAREAEEAEKVQRQKTTEELVKRFGNSIREVPGLLDFLLSQTDTIDFVDAKPKKGVAAFLLDKHWWSGSSGIGKASIVGVYRDGETKSLSFTYRDQYDPRKDDYSVRFTKVEILEITPTTVKVKAIPDRDYSSREHTFEIHAKPKKKKEKDEKLPEPSEQEKAEFGVKVQKAMEKVVANHQYNHPLYQPTQIKEYKIDYQLKLAAWILFEQIDTDRCTPEGEGWLGDQFRYSVWRMKGDSAPVQVYEDHAYIRPRTPSGLTGTRGRECTISNLRLDKGKVIVRNYQGEEMTY